MVMIAARLTMIVCALAILSGCGDEVVGYFDTSGAAGATTSTSTTTTTSTSTSASTSASASTDTGDSGFIAPGCFGDDFENGVIDSLWNTWIEEDATLEEAGGMLKLTPPSFGVWDTGVVGAYNYVFPFVNAHVRLRVPVPPATARPVALYLTVGDTVDTTVTILLANGVVVASGAIDLVEQYREEFPFPTYPAWIGLRAEGAVVHFEVSDDGAQFTTLTTRDKIAEFATANALIMAQTYSEDLDRSLIGVDDFETCVE